MQAINDWIIVEPDRKEEKQLDSGLFVPENRHEERPLFGTIISVGSGRKLPDGRRLPLSRKVGERVIFKKFSNQEVWTGSGSDRKMIYILKEHDIIATIE